VRNILNIRTLKILFYVLMAVSFVYLLRFVIFNSNVEYSRRSFISSSKITDYDYKEYECEDSPLNFAREFILKLDKEQVNNASVIGFYVSNSYVEAFIDDQLVYSLTSKNTYTSTVGSNYIMIPILDDDVGKDLKVIIKPVYESFKSAQVRFYYGSSIEVFRGIQDINNASTVGSVLVMFVGIIIIIFSAYYFFYYKYQSGLEFLGIFMILTGLWRITDTWYTPFIFAGETLVSYYISLLSLFIIPIPLLMYAYMNVSTKHRDVLKHTAFLGVMLSLLIIIIDTFTSLELRYFLSVSHIYIVLSIIAFIYTFVRDYQDTKTINLSALCCSAIIFGVAYDIAVYYMFGNSINCTGALLSCFIVALTIMFTSVKRLIFQSNIDVLTGISNNNVCQKLISNPNALPPDTVFVEFDLNGLKGINDDFGHLAGDRLLVDFSNILRANLPRNSFVGRFGGDEFISVIYNCNEDTFKKILSKIDKEVAKANKSRHNGKISYSVGYVMSNHFDNPLLKDMFKAADSKMYRKKKNYYKTHERRR